MSKSKKDRALWRPLLTETLPYEVPVIFSNDRFFAALVAISKTADTNLRKEFEKVVGKPTTGTSPYFYKIVKDRFGETQLGIIHPIWQMRIAEFYRDYGQSILDFSNKSEFSLRRPVAITSIFSKSELSHDDPNKLGIPNIDPADGEIDISRISSYFSYSKYTLLNRFYDSEEFLRLEKRFSRLRTLDITKCFFNIYTHTITWAVKERTLAKQYRQAHSFEARFDEVMQRANNNETHGIVVGPEVSRIFAELIFQDIDRKVLRRLVGKRVHGQSYAIRRYVDDYLIFAMSDHELDWLEHIVREEIGQYKLFLNERKTATYSRPFVSAISMARSEISLVFSALKTPLDELKESTDEKDLRQVGRAVRARVAEIRIIVGKHQVGFHTISGWLLVRLKEVMRDVIEACMRAKTGAQIEAVTDAIEAILGVVFYVCALDLRVRTTYSLCQIVAMVRSSKAPDNGDQQDRLMHFIAEELSSLVKNAVAVRQLREEYDTKAESVELYNLLICGAFYLGADFVHGEACTEALKNLRQGRLRYFAYITEKFCLLRDTSAFVEELKELNGKVQNIILANALSISVDAETYLFLCDFVGSPDIAYEDKRGVLNAVVGGEIPREVCQKLSLHLGFADWQGLRIDHTLARKELRPAYAWS